MADRGLSEQTRVFRAGRPDTDHASGGGATACGNGNKTLRIVFAIARGSACGRWSIGDCLRHEVLCNIVNLQAAESTPETCEHTLIRERKRCSLKPKWAFAGRRRHYSVLAPAALGRFCRHSPRSGNGMCCATISGVSQRMQWKCPNGHSRLKHGLQSMSILTIFACSDSGGVNAGLLEP